MTSDRGERVGDYHNWTVRELSERIVDLEDLARSYHNQEETHLKRIQTLEGALEFQKDQNKILAKGFMNMSLDPSRLESALRMYVAELDYGLHQEIQLTPDGTDGYPKEVDFFLRCWETAGEN